MALSGPSLGQRTNVTQVGREKGEDEGRSPAALSEKQHEAHMGGGRKAEITRRESPVFPFL